MFRKREGNGIDWVIRLVGGGREVGVEPKLPHGERERWVERCYGKKREKERVMHCQWMVVKGGGCRGKEIKRVLGGGGKGMWIRGGGNRRRTERRG